MKEERPAWSKLASEWEGKAESDVTKICMQSCDLALLEVSKLFWVPAPVSWCPEVQLLQKTCHTPWDAPVQ